KSLQANTARFRQLGNTRPILLGLLKAGELEGETVDGIQYVWPHSTKVQEEPPRAVRFLAPFDPLVWDRRRFEHLWGWPYRFEAYTPAARRSLGYYAMPMLWRGDMVGWVNVSSEGGKLVVDPGFKKAKPTDPAFQCEFQAEVARLQAFLQERLSTRYLRPSTI